MVAKIKLAQIKLLWKKPSQFFPYEQAQTVIDPKNITRDMKDAWIIIRIHLKPCQLVF